MADSTRESEQILRAAGNSLQIQREGGTHRPAKHVGRGSRRIKTNHMVGKLKRIVVATGAIVLGAMVAGLVIDGIGFTGVMLTFFAIVAAVLAFSIFPRMKVPQRQDLNTGSVRQMVGHTELWLEAQRPALPAPAVQLVDQIGVQLDGLGLQLEAIDQNHPATREIRKLVGEHLPGMVDSYRKIPPHLRNETRAGGTADEQLVNGLDKISKEIDSVTRQLADGALDDLAIKNRFLEYRYGGGEDAGVPLEFGSKVSG
ncbi:MAG: hypothetical protein R3E18_10150 [Sphingomonadaceae bacterium]|nr:hypothetical protein [Sphingomonadaceae bacterium]